MTQTCASRYIHQLADPSTFEFQAPASSHHDGGCTSGKLIASGMLHAPKLAAQKWEREKGGYKGGEGIRCFELVGFEELLGMGELSGVVRAARSERVGRMDR